MSAKTDKIKQDVSRELVARLISDMDTAGDWIKPWTETMASRLPFNATTGRRYNGSNIWVLAMKADRMGYRGGQWATYKQWKSVGIQVQKGQKATAGLFSKPLWIDEDTGKRTRPGAEGAVRIFYTNHFNLFHREQTDAEPLPVPVLEEVDNTDAGYALGESLLIDHGIPFTYGGDRAVTINFERIEMPRREQFSSGGRFLATALHEAAHWTGHKSRLDRPRHDGFGSDSYAREELTVELASVLMLSRLGIITEDSDPDGHRAQSAAYIKTWLKGDNTDKVFEVLRHATDIADLLVPESEQDHEAIQPIEQEAEAA